MTAAELSVKLGKSPTWVGQRLNLTKLDEKIQALVDDGTINLTNAIAMSKLPVEEQGTFVERAITMTPAEFTPTVNARIKEVRDAKRQGRDPNAGEFVAGRAPAEARRDQERAGPPRGRARDHQGAGPAQARGDLEGRDRLGPPGRPGERRGRQGEARRPQGREEADNREARKKKRRDQGRHRRQGPGEGDGRR